MLASGSRTPQAPLNSGKVLSVAAVAVCATACFNSEYKKMTLAAPLPSSAGGIDV
jgi:hypothetical protein